jgi:tetratricopeptide (TPR) repeat protein
VQRGVALVDDGEYDSAILILDTASRRLAATPGNAAELSQAYLYLGIAYLGKGQEAAARARFREAVGQIKDLTLSADKFPPKVINIFEAAKEEQGKSVASTAAAEPPVAPAKKKGSSKGLLIGLGAVAVGGGVAAAAGGGGGASNSPSSSTPANDSRQTLNFSGTLGPQGQEGFTAVASRTGTLEARIQWQNGQIALDIGCQEKEPPYTQCTGAYNRTTNTTGVYTTSVGQKSYLVVVSNFTESPEPYTLTILFP